jgi:hypothetical protein
MDANATGVEILQVWGYSFPQAFDMMGNMLCRNRGRNSAGHVSAVEELENLKARYAPAEQAFHCP